MIDNEIVKSVNTVNDYIKNTLGEEIAQSFSATIESDGRIHNIKFMDIIIWSSSADNRVVLNIDDKEMLYDYLVVKIFKIVSYLQKLSIPLLPVRKNNKFYYGKFIIEVLAPDELKQHHTHQELSDQLDYILRSVSYDEFIGDEPLTENFNINYKGGSFTIDMRNNIHPITDRDLNDLNSIRAGLLKILSKTLK